MSDDLIERMRIALKADLTVAEQRGYVRGLEAAAKVVDESIKRSTEQRDLEILGTIDRAVIGRGLFVLNSTAAAIRALIEKPENEKSPAISDEAP